MAAAETNFRFQNPDLLTMNSMYNYSKLEYEKKAFKFKYVSEKQLQKTIKRVSRERKKLEDDKKWVEFLEKKHKELMSPTATQLECDFAQQQLREEQALDSNNVQLNNTNIGGPGENTMKCTCGHVKNISLEQGGQLINVQGLSIPDQAHYFSKFSPQTHVLGTVLEQNSENSESSVYLFSSHDGQHGTDIHNYQQTLFLNSATMKRLLHLSECVRKIGKSLLGVIEKEPISDETAERELMRNTEFGARFTRNYLYRIHREEKELEKLFSTGVSDFILTEKKISSIYQTVIQAVEVYHRHILKCTSTSTFKNLDQVVSIVKTILLYVEKLTGNCNFPYRREIQDYCDNLLKILTHYNKLKTEHKSTSRSIISAKSNLPVKPTTKCSNLLYMYEPKVKQTKWKKPSAMLAKKKFGIPSKHKKINPPRDTVTEVDIRKGKGDTRNSNAESRPPPSRCGSQDLLDNRGDNHKATRTISEDQIVTMVELMQRNEAHALCESANLKDKQSSNTAVKKSKSSQQMWPSNVKLVCVTSDNEPSQCKPKETTSQGLIRKEYVRPENMTRLIVSEQAKNVATTYRNEFMKYCKLAYKINKDNVTDSAWELIPSISDRLTNELVKSACENLEVDALLQKMFDLEFKE